MIYYRDEIIKTYFGFPRMKVEDLAFGDTINWTSGDIKWPETIPITTDFLFLKGIIPYQKCEFSDSPFIYSSHSIIHLLGGTCFSVTAPKAEYIKLTNKNLNPNRAYIVCRYQGYPIGDTPEARMKVYDICNYLNGTTYDYLQLVNFLICSAMGWAVDKYWPILDLGRNNKVCSVGVACAVLNWYYKYAVIRGIDTPRPLGNFDAERTPPCAFESPMYNKNTYKIIGVLDGGLLA